MRQSRTKEYPIYDRLVTLKVDGKQNQEIQEILEAEFNVHHTTEYISTLWRNKIPGLIASQAEDDYLDWYYREVEKGQYKRCSRCGQIKLAHNKYFSKNKTSRDGFYSICKNVVIKNAQIWTNLIKEIRLNLKTPQGGDILCSNLKKKSILL